jgi:hypothetical protein
MLYRSYFGVAAKVCPGPPGRLAGHRHLFRTALVFSVDHHAAADDGPMEFHDGGQPEGLLRHGVRNESLRGCGGAKERARPQRIGYGLHKGS